MSMEFQTKFLSKEEIEQIVTRPASEEEVDRCRRNHLLVSTREGFFEGAACPGSSYFLADGGRKVLDCTSQAWVLNLGHASPDLNYAAALQAQRFVHTWSTYLTDVRVKLCNRLAEVAPGKLKGGKVAVQNRGGGAAIECAVKAAFVARKWGNRVFVCWRGYHGSSLTTMGASQRLPMRFEPFGAEHWVKTPYPYCYRCPWNYEEGLRGRRDPSCSLECLALVRDHVEYFSSGHPAAFLIEPMMGPGGQVPAPADFLAGLKRLCEENRLALIYDEAQTGFGRTGEMFAVDWYARHEGVDVSPDFLCLTKAAAGGYPIGITIAEPKARQLTDYEEHSTFGSPAVSMAAALVNLEILLKGEVLKNAADRGAQLTKRLLELQDDHPEVGDVRGPGLFVGVEFVKDPTTREPHNELLDRVVEGAFKKGVMFGEAMPIMKRTGEMVHDVLKIKPPLTISEEEVDFACDVLEDVLRAALAELN
ncbi:MAG: aspartate aminotransferase family protein [Promethearchaeota archaeon]